MERNKQLKIIQAVNTELSELERQRNVCLNLLHEDISGMQRWNAEKNGETDVGRVLPKEYTFFIGDGFENHFTDEWKSTDYWDWPLPSPYEN